MEWPLEQTNTKRLIRRGWGQVTNHPICLYDEKQLILAINLFNMPWSDITIQIKARIYK